MMFLDDMVVDIPVLGVKEFRMDYACSAMDSIVISGIFLYGSKCTVDLVLSLSILMFRSDLLPVCVVWMALDLLLPS